MQKYKQLSLEERQIIYSLLTEGFSKTQIAKEIKRNPSTITREIQRNKVRIKYTRERYPKYHYLPDSAQIQRNKRRKEANSRPPLKNYIVYNYVIEKLKQNWSPDIIAGTLKQKYKYTCKYTISHEAIYQFIYHKDNERLNLKKYLLRKHNKRKHRIGKTLNLKNKIPNRIDISERLKIFPLSETRQEFGHFEGDSILSVRSTFSAIHTEVERKTRFIFAQKINKKSKEYTEKAILQILDELPKNSIKSITLDNGLEFANHQNITKQLKEKHNIDLKIFFAEPYKSWQRGTNENANGMIRRFYPKGTNFDEITNEELQEVVNYLNNRPRKILNYKTSQEAWDEEIKKLQKATKSNKTRKTQ